MHLVRMLTTSTSVLLYFIVAPNAEGLISRLAATSAISLIVRQRQHSRRSTIVGYPPQTHTAMQNMRIRCGEGVHATIDNAHLEADIPHDIMSSVRSIAEELWGGSESLAKLLPLPSQAGSTNQLNIMIPGQGEMPLPDSIPIPNRCAYFLENVNNNCDARAQHSVGLLLWNGFAEEQGLNIDPEKSAKYHAAAAVQGNLDALAVFGGCLRTGTGVGKHKNIALGLRCIEYAASVGNPSGVNKKGAILESNDDWYGAYQLYKDCYDDDSNRLNALLLFNLGYCLVEGEGADLDVASGYKLWTEAVDMAPDEGSEEAAWLLYQRYEREDAKLAGEYLNIAAELGHQEAMEMASA